MAAAKTKASSKNAKTKPKTAAKAVPAKLAKPTSGKPPAKAVARPASKAPAKTPVKTAVKSAAKPASKPAVKPVPRTVTKTASVLARPTRPASFMPSFGGTAERMNPRLQALLDKSEITELLYNFARGVDRIDENILRSILHADATIDLGPGVFQGSGSDYVRWLLGVVQGIRSSHHLIGNIRVEMEGDAALVESYVHTHFRIEKAIGREDVFMGGRNLDRFERRPAGNGVWKIVHRKQIIDWVRTEAVSDIFYHQNPDALWSYRTKTDASYLMTQFPGTQQSGGKLPSFLGRHYESKSIKF